MSVPFCPLPFCPYHFVRYHFVLEPIFRVDFHWFENIRILFQSVVVEGETGLCSHSANRVLCNYSRPLDRGIRLMELFYPMIWTIPRGLCNIYLMLLPHLHLFRPHTYPLDKIALVKFGFICIFIFVYFAHCTWHKWALWNSEAFPL